MPNKALTTMAYSSWCGTSTFTLFSLCVWSNLSLIYRLFI